MKRTIRAAMVICVTLSVCSSPNHIYAQKSQDQTLQTNYPIIKTSKWIDSFKYEDYNITPNKDVDDINSSRSAGDGKRLFMVDAELYFPTGTWDLTRIALRANDGKDYKLLAFGSYSTGSYSLAEKGETVMSFSKSASDPSAMRRTLGLTREPYKVDFPITPWPGGRFSTGLIFELPKQSQPILLLHGENSRKVTAEVGEH